MDESFIIGKFVRGKKSKLLLFFKELWRRFELPLANCKHRLEISPTGGCSQFKTGHGVEEASYARIELGERRFEEVRSR